MRHRKMLACCLFAVFLGMTFHAVGQTPPGQKTAGPDAGLNRFKMLAGEWVGKVAGHDGKGAQDVSVTYKVTSGGSAVMETLMPNQAKEMITVIHKDGKDLVLTHYCAVGNQPHMKADGKGEGDPNKVAFVFTGGSNMKSDKDMHMHSVTYTFVDNDTLKAEWTHYMDGKEGGTVVFEFKRKPK